MTRVVLVVVCLSAALTSGEEGGFLPTHLQAFFSVVSRVDGLVRRPEGDVRVVVDHDGGDVRLGISGDDRFGELDLIEKQPSVYLLSGWMRRRATRKKQRNCAPWWE